jgi:hypothetical protein
MRIKTQEDLQRQKNTQLIRDILGEEYSSLSYEGLKIFENPNRTDVQCCLVVTTAKKQIESREISGSGFGLVDALFSTLLAEYANDCVSTTALRLEEFYIFVDRADLKRQTQEGKTGAGALVKTCLIVNNGNNGLVPFRSISHSVIAAMAQVVFSAMEFFINSERAVHKLRVCVRDATKRKRPDLTELYTFKMAELVKNASYAESLKTYGLEEKKEE